MQLYTSGTIFVNDERCKRWFDVTKLMIDIDTKMKVNHCLTGVK